MLKHIFFVLILIFFIFLQFSLLPHLSILHYVNLVWCFLLIYLLSRKKLSLIYFILAGLLLDLYSIMPPGFYLIIFLLTFLFINWLCSRVTDASPWLNLLIVFVSLLVYQVSSIVLGLIFHYFRLTTQQLILDGYYLKTILWFIVFNTIIIFIVNQIWAILLKSRRIVWGQRRIG